MGQGESVSRSIVEIAKNAFSEMGDRGVQVTPKNYHVWFDHLTGANYELSRAIENELSKHPTMAQELSDKLYEKFIGQEHQNLLALQIQHELQGILHSTRDEIASAGDGAGAFGERLGGYGEKLGSTNKLSALKELVGDMVRDTNAMAESSHQMQQRLEETTQEIEKLTRDLEKAEVEATQDGLTGIRNRKGARRALDLAELEWVREQKAFTVVLADIDRFKQFNDTYGHAIGDAVLRMVAKSLSDGVKGQDVPCRWGGEEFLIILPWTSLENGLRVAEGLRLRVADRKLKLAQTDQLLDPVTMSFGVAQIRIGDSVDDVVDRADKAMYAAKKSGRNRVHSETLIEVRPAGV